MSSSEQRSGRTRREFLGAVGLATGLLGSGCLTAQSAASRPVSILSAGSLQTALTTGLANETPTPIEVESHGSATVARLLINNARNPDIVAVADPALFTELIHPDWYATFASNALVIAYNPTTDDGQQLETAGSNWYELLATQSISLGRTDPGLDPLGYRTLFMLDLAAQYYKDAGDLRDTILTQNQLYPETSLLSRFETGALDAAIVYRNMAIERDYPYITLPDQINLGNPGYRDTYSRTSYTLPDGTTITGNVIEYAATTRSLNPPIPAVFQSLVTGSYLTTHGFLKPDTYPQYSPNAPQSIAD